VCVGSVGGSRARAREPWPLTGLVNRRVITRTRYSANASTSMNERNDIGGPYILTRPTETGAITVARSSRAFVRNRISMDREFWRVLMHVTMRLIDKCFFPTGRTLVLCCFTFNFLLGSMHRKKGHSCFENMFSFNIEILKWDYIALIQEKYNCLNKVILYSSINKNIFLWFKI